MENKSKKLPSFSFITVVFNNSFNKTRYLSAKDVKNACEHANAQQIEQLK